MPFDVDAARQAGASDDEILSYLAQRSPNFDVQGALKVASKADVVNYLAANATAPQRQPSFSEQHPYIAGAASAIGNAVVGAVKSAAQTSRLVGGVGSLTGFESPDFNPDYGQLEKTLTPKGTAQQVGAAAEQAGELYLTGGPLRAMAKGAVGALGRMGLEGANMAVNAAVHGQDVTTGAVVGGLTAGGAQLAEKIAPKIAEAALGTRFSERMYGRNPGTAIISNTSGVSPQSIAQSAKATSRQMVGELESSAAAASAQGVTTSTRPALNILDDAISRATAENNAAELGTLEAARDQLTRRLNPQTFRYDGEPIPENLSPRDLLNLKRGLGDTITNWSRIPERQGASGILKQVYHALDAEFDRAVPGAAQTNQIVSTLIGVGRDAERKDLMPGIAQSVAGRMLAHTGALTGSVAGGYAGYQRGGVEGGIVGGLAGLIFPEVMARPSTLMTAARGTAALASPAVGNAAAPALINSLMNRRRGQ